MQKGDKKQPTLETFFTKRNKPESSNTQTHKARDQENSAPYSVPTVAQDINKARPETIPRPETKNYSNNHQPSTSPRKQPPGFKPLFDNRNKTDDIMLGSSDKSDSLKSTSSVDSSTNCKQTHKARKEKNTAPYSVAQDIRKVRAEKTRENYSNNQSTSSRKQPPGFKPLFDNTNRNDNSMLGSSGKSESFKKQNPVDSCTNYKQPQQIKRSKDKVPVNQIMNERKNKGRNADSGTSMGNYGAVKKSLGYSYQSRNQDITDERLKGIDPKMVELINNEIMDHGPPVNWTDIAGLEFAKTVIKEIVVWPMLRPDIFKGLRAPPKGLLLFGPPGTGKTLIGKCIASQSKATFFSISASSLTSKWMGESEKMVRALFAVARCHQPAVIFIDEIDSLLSQRSDRDYESSRRIKTEFFIQLDGATSSSEDRLVVVGATNRPQDIDEAARRRLVKRLYIPLPEGEARKQIICNLLKDQRHSLSEEDFEKLTQRSEGYSGSDMSNLCREAALGPIRSISGNIQAITPNQVRPIVFEDFENALRQVRASVSTQDLDLYVSWNKQFGSGH